MEGFGFPVFWCMMVLILCGGFQTSEQNNNTVCESCDDQPSICQSTGICEQTCRDYCVTDGICVSIWSTKNGKVSVKSLCHNPAEPLNGVTLDDYKSLDCTMKQYDKLGSDVYMCSCSGYWCNRQLIFSRGSGEVCQYLAVFVIISTAVCVGVGSAVCLQKLIRSRGGWRWPTTLSNNPSFSNPPPATLSERPLLLLHPPATLSENPLLLLNHLAALAKDPSFPAPPPPT